MRRYIQNVKIHLGIRALLVVGSIFVLYAYGNFANTFMNKVFQKSGVDFVCGIKMRTMLQMVLYLGLLAI